MHAIRACKMGGDSFLCWHTSANESVMRQLDAREDRSCVCRINGTRGESPPPGYSRRPRDASAVKPWAVNCGHGPEHRAVTCSCAPPLIEGLYAFGVRFENEKWTPSRHPLAVFAACCVPLTFQSCSFLDDLCSPHFTVPETKV